MIRLTLAAMKLLLAALPGLAALVVAFTQDSRTKRPVPPGAIPLSPNRPADASVLSEHQHDGDHAQDEHEPGHEDDPGLLGVGERPARGEAAAAVSAPERHRGESSLVQDWFGTVLFAVVIFGAIIGVITFVVRGRLYDQIGRGGLFSLDVPDRPLATPAPTSAAGQRERDDEIRQMLQARNERRARKGQAALDVEQELAKLTAPAPVADPGLVEEVRQLVVARNERRARAGEPPLDVEAEVERQLREFGA